MLNNVNNAKPSGLKRQTPLMLPRNYCSSILHMTDEDFFINEFHFHTFFVGWISVNFARYIFFPHSLSESKIVPKRHQQRASSHITIYNRVNICDWQSGIIALVTFFVLLPAGAECWHAMTGKRQEPCSLSASPPAGEACVRTLGGLEVAVEETDGEGGCGEGERKSS